MFDKDIFYGIKDKKIIEAIESIPREDFVPDRLEKASIWILPCLLAMIKPYHSHH